MGRGLGHLIIGAIMAGQTLGSSQTPEFRRLYEAETGFQPSPGPKEIVRSSDLVVVGELDQVEPEPDQAKRPYKYAWYWKGRLDVREVLKGQPKSMPLAFRMSAMKSAKPSPRPSPPYAVGQSGIWCLKWSEELQAYMPQPYEKLAVSSLEEVEQVKDWLAGPPTQPSFIFHVPLRIKRLDLGFSWKSNPTKLIVAAVRPSSAAAEGQFLPGDEIDLIETQRVKGVKEFHRTVSSYTAGQRLKVQVLVRPSGEKSAGVQAGEPLRSIKWLRLPASYTPAGCLSEESAKVIIQEYVYSRDGTPKRIFHSITFREADPPGRPNPIYLVRLTEKIFPDVLPKQGRFFVVIDARTGDVLDAGSD